MTCQLKVEEGGGEGKALYIDTEGSCVIQRLIDTQWADNVKARLLNREQDNSYRGRRQRGRVRSQEQMHRYYLEEQRRELEGSAAQND